MGPPRYQCALLYPPPRKRGGQGVYPPAHLMTDGIFRLYSLDSEGFGPFAYFDYSPGCLVGCAEESTEYLEFYP